MEGSGNKDSKLRLIWWLWREREREREREYGYICKILKQIRQVASWPPIFEVIGRPLARNICCGRIPHEAKHVDTSNKVQQCTCLYNIYVWYYTSGPYVCFNSLSTHFMNVFLHCAFSRMLIHRVPSHVWFRKKSQMFHLEELHPALGQWYFGCSVDGNFSIVSHPNVFLLTCVNERTHSGSYRRKPGDCSSWTSVRYAAFSGWRCYTTCAWDWFAITPAMCFLWQPAEWLKLLIYIDILYIAGIYIYIYYIIFNNICICVFIYILLYIISYRTAKESFETMFHIIRSMLHTLIFDSFGKSATLEQLSGAITGTGRRRRGRRHQWSY